MKMKIVSATMMTTGGKTMTRKMKMMTIGDGNHGIGGHTVTKRDIIIGEAQTLNIMVIARSTL
jgi:hypothetical protein